MLYHHGLRSVTTNPFKARVASEVARGGESQSSVAVPDTDHVSRGPGGPPGRLLT
jgi:hypothetical protein